MIYCAACETGFEPTRSRWLCPACGWKETCCEGEPLTCHTPSRTPTGAPDRACPTTSTMIGGLSRT